MKLFDLIRHRYLLDRYSQAEIDYVAALDSVISGSRRDDQKTRAAIITITENRYKDFSAELRDKYGIHDHEKLTEHLRSFTGYRIVRFIFQLLGMGHYV